MLVDLVSDRYVPSPDCLSLVLSFLSQWKRDEKKGEDNGKSFELL